ncbi:MAG: polyprenyl synthetase family protein, partial [Ilumatobacteraceae bacterium]
LKSVATRVESRLSEFLQDEQDRWSALDGDLNAPLGELTRLVAAGGKRLRPAFCYLAFVGVGGDENSKQLLDTQAALELLHASALLHDDIIDGSLTRRGEPTSHTRYIAKHLDSKWAGEARRFGEGAVILIGDLAFVYADQLMTGVNSMTAKVWNEMRIEVNIGQYLDLLGSAQRERNLNKAERVCRYKSGKYTVERPLHLGATLAAPEQADVLLEQLSNFGLPLGDAFQMRDDVLGAFGDTSSSLTGKPIGDDLREGKPTPLLAMACERATVAQREVLDRVGAPQISHQEISDIQQVIIETGALDALETKISMLVEQSVNAVSKSSLDESSKSRLIELAEFVASRKN